jgi:hypothetical protein
MSGRGGMGWARNLLSWEWRPPLLVAEVTQRGTSCVVSGTRFWRGASSVTLGAAQMRDWFLPDGGCGEGCVRAGCGCTTWPFRVFTSVVVVD